MVVVEHPARRPRPWPARDGRPADSLVIVPTYNEAANLERLVREIQRAGPFDVLIVDDHSPDGTGELADRLAVQSDGRVSVVHRAAKLGLGTAYVAGFRVALAGRYARVFEMDADFSHDPACLPMLHAALDEADVVLGSRYVHGGATPRRWPAWRRALSQGGSLYAGLLLGLPFHDLTGGFKGFRRSALAALDLGALRSSGYAFQIEVTYRCFQRGLRIVERPIVFHERARGQSKMRPRIVSEALLLVLRLRLSAT